MPSETQNGDFFKKSNHISASDADYLYSENRFGQYISDRLAALPKIKAAQDFEQKLAARMSLELEEESARRNRSLLKKNKCVSIPGPVLNFNK